MAMLKQMTSLHQYKSICRLFEEEWDVYLETQKKADTIYSDWKFIQQYNGTVISENTEY